MSERYSAIQALTDEQFVEYLSRHGLTPTESERGSNMVSRSGIMKEGVEVILDSNDCSSESIDVSMNYTPQQRGWFNLENSTK